MDTGDYGKENNMKLLLLTWLIVAIIISVIWQYSTGKSEELIRSNRNSKKCDFFIAVETLSGNIFKFMVVATGVVFVVWLLFGIYSGELH